jgi:osmotically-inducible protein OsmY
MTQPSSSRHAEQALLHIARAAVEWVAPANSDVEVVLQDGAVVVRGSVRSVADRDRVLAAATAAPTAQVVVDDVQVRSMRRAEASDEAVAAQLCRLLATMPSVHVEGVRIRVRRGVVTVRGEIPWPFERDTLVNLIGAVSGVEDVVDVLEVRRTDHAHAAPASA